MTSYSFSVYIFIILLFYLVVARKTERKKNMLNAIHIFTHPNYIQFGWLYSFTMRRQKRSFHIGGVARGTNRHKELLMIVVDDCIVCVFSSFPLCMSFVPKSAPKFSLFVFLSVVFVVVVVCRWRWWFASQNFIHLAFFFLILLTQATVFFLFSLHKKLGAIKKRCALKRCSFPYPFCKRDNACSSGGTQRN